MWKDLTLKEKAEIMKMSVANGVTDINDIQELYDSSIPNQFDDGGFVNFYNSLPRNQRDSTNYNVRRYWELNGKPKDFNEAVQRGMYTKQSDGWHANSVAYNEAKDEYEFMKSPTHPTTIYEIGAYLNNKDFQKEYYLDYTSKPNYKYRRKPSWMYDIGGHLYKNAGPVWSNNPASMIEHFEGFRESPYRDGTAWSVGYGQYKNGYGANLDWDALLSGKKKLTRSEAHQQVLRTITDLKKKLKNTLGEKLYNSLTPGQLMGYLDTGYQRPASMINAAKIHKNKGAAAAASVLGVSGFADRNAARRAAFTGNWDNYVERNNREYTPNKSTSDNYIRQTVNGYEAPAFQPITLNSANVTSPWLDYISKIGQQRPVSFNTPIGPSNKLASNNQINIGPVDFSNIGKVDELMSFVDPYTSKQALEYNLGLENNALWNSPYLLFNEHSAANGGHLYDTAGQMLIRNNAVNPALQYVYGPEYEEIIRQRRNWRPSNRTNIQRTKPKYDIEARGDITTNTVGPVQRVIRRKQTSESPARRAKEQQRYDTMMTQYRNERQGTISQAPNRLRHSDYDPVKANQVQQRYEQNEIAERNSFNRRALEHNVLEGMEAIPWPSTVAGSLFNPNTHWYDPGSFFSNLYANDNRGFFNFNQATRDFYDANPEVGAVANLIGDFIVPGAAAKALKGIGKIPEVSRNLVASSAINYGAKTRSLPTNIYKSRNLFINGPEGKWIKDSDPFVEFINSKRGVPDNTSFFLRTPRDINILKLRNGRYKAKAEGNIIVPSGSVDGKFVSYGEPWMEFGTNDLTAWYEFPTSTWASSKKVGGRGPYRTATDWRGNEMDYDVTEAWRNMMLRQDPKFIAEEKAMYENLRAQKFNSSQERVQAHKAARKAFYEKWGYNPDIDLDVYHGNQTVIPSNRWNFNSEYPRGFLSQPFWRYTQDPYSGAVQKELMMNWETPMKALDKTHADIIPFIDPETGTWDYLTDFKVSNNAQLDVNDLLSKFSFDNVAEKYAALQQKLRWEQEQAAYRAQEKILDYFGSEDHIQQIMKSGKSRKKAEEISNQMRDNVIATELKLDYPRTPNALGEYDSDWHPEARRGIASFGLFGRQKHTSFEPIAVTHEGLAPEDILHNVIHELGGHGATMGYRPGRYSDIPKANEWYEADMAEWFPHYKEVYENNAALKPIRKDEYISVNDPKIEEHIKYLEDVEEYATRARSQKIDKEHVREDFQELYKYFTKESVDKLLKGVWSLLPAGIGLEAIKSKSK